MEKKKFKLGLLPKLLIAIVLGIIVGQFFPVWFCRVIVTASSIFSSFLKFVIPLMIVAYVTMGIADLKSGAGKLLLITVALAYGSTLIAGSASYLVSANLFPSFMSEGALEQIAATADNSLASYISISIPPILDTLSAVVLAFVLGLCMSTLRGKTIGDTLYNGMKDFSGIIDQVLHSVIIPLLPLYVCGTFIDMKDLCHSGHPVEGVPGGHHHAPDLHLHPVLCRRRCEPQEPPAAHQEPDPRLHHRTGHPVLGGYHPGQPAVCRGGRRERTDP